MVRIAMGECWEQSSVRVMIERSSCPTVEECRKHPYQSPPRVSLRMTYISLLNDRMVKKGSLFFFYLVAKMVRIYGVCVTLHVMTTSLPAAKITSTRPSELLRVRVFLTPSFNVPLTQPSNALSKQRIFLKKKKHWFLFSFSITSHP